MYCSSESIHLLFNPTLIMHFILFSEAIKENSNGQHKVIYKTIVARFMRVIPLARNELSCMTMELYGCGKHRISCGRSLLVVLELEPGLLKIVVLIKYEGLEKDIIL